MNRRHIALAVLVVATIASAGHAFATGMADPAGEPPTTPTGVGDLMPTPDLTHGDTRNLFESYSSMSYFVDNDEGTIPNGVQGILNSYANMLCLYIIAVTRGAISVGWWLFNITQIKDVSTATTGIITSASSALATWLLPAAIAFGGVLAFARQRGSRDGGAFSQIIWVVASAVLAISFGTSAGMWVNGIDSARQLGATAVMDATSRSITSDNTQPFEMPAPSYDKGSQRDKLLRQSADATWRAFAVTPWCLAEFGSMEACKRYGKGMLDVGTNNDARKNYIKKEIERREGGGDAATVKWVKGENPVARIGILALGLVAATIFAALTISLCFAAALAFIGSLLMLVAGVFFACLWVIPGRPRQWGINWFETLLGLVLQSVLALLVFGSALSLVTAVYTLSGSMGWLPVNGLALAVLFAAFRMRRMLEGVTQMMRPGMGSSGLLGALALRQMMRLGGRAWRAANRFKMPQRTPRTRTSGNLPGGDPSIDDPNRIRPGNVRPNKPMPQWDIYHRSNGHRNPELPRPVRPLPGGPDRPKLTGGPDGPQLPPRPGGRPPRGPLPAGSSGGGAARQLTAGPTRAGGRTRSNRPGDSTHVIVRDGSASTKAPTERKERPQDSRAAYTPGKVTNRYQTGSSSGPTLREGPPQAGTRIRPVAQRPRTYRRYDQVTREGVTLHVPKKDQR